MSLRPCDETNAPVLRALYLVEKVNDEAAGGDSGVGKGGLGIIHVNNVLIWH